MTRRLILASSSPARIALLEHAGLDFIAEAAAIDERAVEAPLIEAGSGGPDVALALAEAKAAAVATRHPDDVVVGADQVMQHEMREGGGFGHKPASRDEAAALLAALAGKVHWLHTGAVVVASGAPVWRHSTAARLAMRALGPDDIDAYLDEVGDAALASVGAYQIEGPGIRLFDDIHGDYFSILGLPLLPLLKALRAEGIPA